MCDSVLNAHSEQEGALEQRLGWVGVTELLDGKTSDYLSILYKNLYVIAKNMRKQPQKGQKTRSKKNHGPTRF
jgi:hypothetical protein